jgi:hypothetical protein
MEARQKIGVQPRVIAEVSESQVGQMHAKKMKGNRNRREFFSWIEFGPVLSCKLVTGLLGYFDFIRLTSFTGHANLKNALIFRLEQLCPAVPNSQPPYEIEPARVPGKSPSGCRRFHPD